MKKIIVVLLAAAGLAVWSLPVHGADGDTNYVASPMPPPATFCLDGRRLEEGRRRVLANDPAMNAAVAKLRRAADRACNEKLQAVTDKPFASPSGDQHDYVSLSTYFWPNPKTSDGLPYVLRDGETNPENQKYDTSRLKGMTDNVKILSLAYYLTGEQRYAARAASQIRRWFLEPQTRMNPSLKYAQLIKGMNGGSRWGIIDTAMLIWVVDADALLRGNSDWTSEDHRRLQQWFATYLEWLRTSALGKQEDDAQNNHGSYYDLQMVDFALFTGQQEFARAVVEAAKTKRIAGQIEPDGSQPQELARTKAYDYCIVNLTALFHLAQLAGNLKIDLWNYHSADGRGLRAALDWMIPYATGRQPWTHRQIIPQTSTASFVGLLHQAAIAYQEPAYEKIIPQVKGGPVENLTEAFLAGPARAQK